jgi:7-cyano-7-deazaguanine synthase
MLSGGLDSTAMAWILVKKRNVSLKAIYVDHGQPAANREIEVARKTSAALGIPLKIIDGSGLWPSFKDLIESQGGVHMMTSSGSTAGSAGIAIAACYAAMDGAERLYLGIVAEDLEGRPWLVDLMEHYANAVRCVKTSTTGAPPQSADYRGFSIELPIKTMSKSEIIVAATAVGAPLHETWSCQYSPVEQCGECWICQMRKRAFSDSGVEDQTRYSR